MLQNAPKLNLLDHFYEYLEEGDWLDGVDLYQAGRVENLETFEGLITSKVSSFASHASEVRLKIHPAGNCIQWIECTCRKNRALGAYCEHIAALMIHVDREKPELFRGLDTSMPMKPPSLVKKKRETVKSRAGASQNGITNAAETILDHLSGKIQGVHLMGSGPGLRVRLEIKEGQITHYDLKLDAAAKFLKDHPKLPQAADAVKSLKVYETNVEIGCRFFQPEDEKIIMERVVALRLTRAPSDKQLAKMNLTFDMGSFTRFSPQNDGGKEGLYLFVPLKVATKNMGRDYFFMSGRGYWPIDRTQVLSEWNDLPLTKSFKDDEAAKLAASGFADYLGLSPIYFDKNLKDPVIMETISLSHVKVLDEKDGWFRLDPRYGLGKSQVSMAELMQAHKERRRKYIKSGKVWLKIPDFITEHDWQVDQDGTSIKVDSLGLMRIKAAIGDLDQFVGSKKILNEIRNRLEFTPEGNPPQYSQSNLDLRTYQEIGLKWLWWLYQNGLHGLLADEMGLGKTHQAMAMMTCLQTIDPNAKFLVVCPTTVLDHWIDKIEEYAPGLNATKYHGTKRATLLKSLDQGQSTLITSYGVVLRDVRKLAAIPWATLILDEAHFVKNNDTATYRAVCRINSRIRICLSGTPMENHLGELKNIFDFLVPGYLGSDDYFKKHFIEPLRDKEAPEREVALQRLIHPFKLRRTKELVLPDLPAKVEDVRHCMLSPMQVKLYRDTIELKANPLVAQLETSDKAVPFLHVFATLSLLKQICDHPALAKRDKNYQNYESGKFDLLKELLIEALDSGHKVVIYSQYVGMIDIISRYLSDIQVNHVVMTGQTRKRGQVVKAFQEDPEIKVFCGSLLAGGIGIDLTSASVVIHYDRWWNASKENQATDRVHRIGQNKNVQVLKLIARGTLEEKIDSMIKNKQALFNKFLNKDEEVFKTLSRAELIELLR